MTSPASSPGCGRSAPPPSPPARTPNAPVFYGLRDGSQGLTDALVAALPDGAVRTGTTVTAVVPADGGGFNVATAPTGAADAPGGAGALPIHADAVVLATPAWAGAEVLRALQPDIAVELDELEWSSVVMVTLAVPRTASDHPLDGSGFLVAGNEDLTLSACSFSSSKWAHLGPVAGSERGAAGDTVLLRVSAGRHPDATPVDLDDTTLVATIRGELATIIGLDPRLDLGPDRSRVTRWRRALPQYRPGHQQRARGWRDALRSAWPGLWLTGASYDGLGIPACITDAEAVARQVAATVD